MNNKQYSDENIKDLIIAAKSDSLTGLLNHHSTFKEITDYLKHNVPKNFDALFMIDLDNFKKVNDTLGHQYGDQVIINVADTLTSLFRNSDIVGRVGGDEFLVLLKNVISLDVIQNRAEEIVSSIQIICKSEDEIKIEVTCSVGVVVCDKDNRDFEQLYREADLAMFSAKKDNKNNYVVNFGDYSHAPAKKIEKPNYDIVSLYTLFKNIKTSVILFESSNIANPEENFHPIYVSPNYYDTLNIKRDSNTIPTTLEWQSILYPEDKEVFLKFIHSINSKNEIQECQYRIISGTGEIQWRMCRCSRIPSSGLKENQLALVITDITELKKNELILLESNLRANEYIKRMEMIIDPSLQIMWDVNLITNKLTIHYTDQIYQIDFNENTPDKLVEDNILHPAYKDKLAKFIKNLYLAEDQNEGIFKFRFKKESGFTIARIKYFLLKNHNNISEKIVGICELMLNIEYDLFRFAWHERFFDAMQNNMPLQCKFNITEDKFKLTSTDGTLLPTSKTFSSFDEAYYAYSKNIVDVPMQKQFLQNFKKSNLLKLCREGIFHLQLVHQYLNQNDNIVWIVTEASMFVHPISKDIYAFIYSHQIQRREQIAHYSLTPLHEDFASIRLHDAFKEVAEGILNEHRHNNVKHALLYIIIEGKKTPSGKLKKLSEWDIDMIYFQIRLLLKNDFVLGRDKRNALLLFHENCDTESNLISRMEQLLSNLNNIYKSPDEPSDLVISIFVSTMPSLEASYISMLSQVYTLCELIDNKEETSQVFSMRSLAYKEDTKLDLLDKLNIKNCKYFHQLNDEDKDLVLQTALDLTADQSHEQHLRTLLHKIGMYYKADRVHLLKVFANEKRITCLQDWNTLGKFSIMQNYKDRKISDILAIQKVIKKRTAITLGIKDYIQLETQQKKWKYIAVPIFFKEKVSGIISIENPHVNLQKIELIQSICHVISEINLSNFVNKDIDENGNDILTGLRSKSEFETVGKYNDQKNYRSLGIVYLELINDEKLKSTIGEFNVDNILRFGGEACRKVFQDGASYRASENTFVILHYNDSKQFFEQLVYEIKNILNSSQVVHFALGYVWANDETAYRELLLRAHRKMQLNKEQYLNSMLNIPPTNLQPVPISNPSYEFILYFQPQCNAITGDAESAEVLVRKKENDKIFPPSTFIPFLEKNGKIKELDFFVFEQALVQLTKWVENGKPIIPISVNFSRYSLLSNSAIASIIAIHSRYNIPPEYIKIEITESIGEYNQNQISSIITMLHSYGFLVSLDDFGSSYANLSILTNCDFDEIKIDKSIIAQITTSNVSRTLVKSVLKICEDMDAECIVEGVETQNELDCLIELGCKKIQGYYFGKPVSVAEFEQTYLNKKEEQNEKSKP